MGRSRRRARAAGVAPPAAAARAAAPREVSPRELRKSLGAYLAGAILLAIVVLVATVALAPAWAPWAVLVAAGAAAYLLWSWATARLSGLALSDEDRVMQTLATGLLIVALAFAAIAAVVLTVA